jgi:hypothetical protein
MDIPIFAIIFALLFLAIAGGWVIWARAGARAKATLALEGPQRPRREPVAMAPGAGPAKVLPADRHVYSGLTKTQAEELLDWLQAHGQTDFELSYEPASGFTIRRPQPPGAQPSAGSGG